MIVFFRKDAYLPDHLSSGKERGNAMFRILIISIKRFFVAFDSFSITLINSSSALSIDLKLPYN